MFQLSSQVRQVVWLQNLLKVLSIDELKLEKTASFHMACARVPWKLSKCQKL